MENGFLRLKSVYKNYAQFGFLWIKFKNADKHGVLPTKSVDNRVENVDSPVDSGCVYAMFCHKFRNWKFVEVEIFTKCVMNKRSRKGKGEGSSLFREILRDCLCDLRLFDIL